MITDDQDGPFHDLDAFVALPRVEGLRLAPDGDRLVVEVATPGRENKGYVRALWEVDPAGVRPARQLTRSDEGESVAAFTPGGDLLFISSRPQPGVADDDKPPASLWVQPAGGGDARVVASPPGGVRGVVVSADGTVVLGSNVMPSAAAPDEDKGVRDERKKAGVSAILHEEYPVRYWDHDLGPHRTRLLIADAGAGYELRDLTGHAGLALDDNSVWDLTPDGRTVVTMWTVAEPEGSQRQTLVAIDVATGERRDLVGDAGHDYGYPRVSPDGTQVAFIAERRSTQEDPGDSWVAVIPLAGGVFRALTDRWDRAPGQLRWTPDGTTLITMADDHGRTPLWRIDVASGDVTRITADNGAYSSFEVAPDGRSVFAVRAAVDSPPAPVRVSLDGEITVLPGPGPADLRVPGQLTEVTAAAADGTPLRAWLVLPATAGPASPAPLLLWVHGGPQSSWSGWTWRWNPWIAVAQGYAVLLPDPALSTGYGTNFIRRGWGDWGGTPFTDLMTITDAAEARPDIDDSRTAAMGGSFGGYMANWIAGHTDRFKAIVTHASLWALEPFAGTTDASFYWVREMTDEMTIANSPHRFADNITTPMLVIHGDKDYRVPIGEGLRLWWSLMSRQSKADEPTPHKFLYFPDENHWILKPGNAKVWYATVLAFLAHHVRGDDWQRPHLLG